MQSDNLEVGNLYRDKRFVFFGLRRLKIGIWIHSWIWESIFFETWLFFLMIMIVDFNEFNTFWCSWMTRRRSINWWFSSRTLWRTCCCFLLRALIWTSWQKYLLRSCLRTWLGFYRAHLWSCLLRPFLWSFMRTFLRSFFLWSLLRTKFRALLWSFFAWLFRLLWHLRCCIINERSCSCCRF